MFSVHGKTLLNNSYRYYTMLYGYGKYQFIILHILIFFGKGKLKDCRKKLFRIYLYSHSRDAPAACTAFAFSDLSGYKSFEN